MQNPDIARVFDEVADLLEIQNANPFRVRAYRTAARTVRDYPESLTDLVRDGTRDLTELPGIGDDLAAKIQAIVKRGLLPLHEQLTRRVPPGLLDLLRIPGIGPKRAKLLYTKLKVRSPAELGQALAEGRVRKLKGFGPTLVAKIQRGLGQAEHAERRLLLQEAESHASALLSYLRKKTGIEQITIAGSLSRAHRARESRLRER